MPISNLQPPVSIPPASASNNGLMTANDKSKLDSLVTTTVTYPDTDTIITLTLANNTVYELTSSALSSLSIQGVASNFEYATITFTSGPVSATMFVVPQDGVTPSTIYRCTGADCTGGAFIPVTDKRYNLAIFQEYDHTAIYVMDATV